MKKIQFLSLLTITVLAVGCKNTGNEPPENAEIPAKKVTAEMPAKAPDVCDETFAMLVVNTKLLKDDGIYNAWNIEQDNTELFYDNPTLDRKGHTHDYQLISLKNFKNMTQQTNWLQDHSKYICYDESYQFIEKPRMVKPTNARMQLALSKATEYSVKFTDIINQSKIQLTDNYKYFLTVTMTTNSAPTFGKTNQYSDEPVCLSMPFLNSIFVNNGIGITDLNKCEFAFRCVDVKSYNVTTTVVAFRVKYNNTYSDYYDYSTQPGSAALILPYL